MSHTENQLAQLRDFMCFLRDSVLLGERNKDAHEEAERHIAALNSMIALHAARKDAT